MSTPLSVLDLVPISTGSNAPEALRNSIDLAQRAESLGYARYWFAEHHLNPGVAGTSPAVVLALVAGATSSIRLGSAAVQLGHRTALSTVEEFGLLDALHPGRFDLGLGRSGGKPPGSETRAPSRPDKRVLDNGLVIPPAFDYSQLLGSPRIALSQALLKQPGATSQPYSEQVADILALIAGTYRAENGEEAHVIPGEGADLQIWIHGSSAGESAQVAGANGVRFGMNYHVAPSGVLEAVAAYREAFVPSATLGSPYVIVSADVVVAEEDQVAADLAAGYGPWVRSIRTAQGAIQYPTAEQARALPWEPDDAALVADRVDTQFVGTPEKVADQLAALRDATGADELLVTTITHDHEDRVRSLELLAKEWQQR